MPERTWVPTRKVLSGGAVGAAVTLVVYILNTYVPLFQAHPFSAEAAAMATTALSAMVAWLVPPGASETTIQDSSTGAVRTAVQTELPTKEPGRQHDAVG